MQINIKLPLFSTQAPKLLRIVPDLQTQTNSLHSVVLLRLEVHWISSSQPQPTSLATSENKFGQF
jgi:hypothetical protein